VAKRFAQADYSWRLEGIARRPYSMGGGGSEQGLQNRRKHMRVLVSIEVRNLDSGAKQARELSSGFSLHFVGIEATAHNGLQNL
jgi:hypothetical protein